MSILLRLPIYVFNFEQFALHMELHVSYLFQAIFHRFRPTPHLLPVSTPQDRGPNFLPRVSGTPESLCPVEQHFLWGSHWRGSGNVPEYILICVNSIGF